MLVTQGMILALRFCLLRPLQLTLESSSIDRFPPTWYVGRHQKQDIITHIRVCGCDVSLPYGVRDRCPSLHDCAKLLSEISTIAN